MTDEEFRAIIAQGPAVVMVESKHMIALLDERDGLKAENARMRDALTWYVEHGAWPVELVRDGGETARAALAPHGGVKP
jgi:hypothetical protein